MTLYYIIMRTIINIPQRYIDALTDICQREKISRAEVIRRAIDNYLQRKTTSDDTDIAFGIWKTKISDALEYEDNLRSEWI